MANLSNTEGIAWGGRILHTWQWGINGVGVALCQVGKNLPRKRLLTPAIHRGWENSLKRCAKCERVKKKMDKAAR